MKKRKGVVLDQVFAAHMARRRAEMGITYRALGAKAGVTGTYIYQIEAGIRTPTLLTMQKIAEAVGMTVPAMLTEGSHA